MNVALADNSISSDELRLMVEALIAAKCAAVGANYGEVTPNTNLFNEGIIDSFDVVELLTELEEKTGISAIMDEDEEEEFLISVNWFVKRFATNSK